MFELVVVFLYISFYENSIHHPIKFLHLSLSLCVSDFFYRLYPLFLIDYFVSLLTLITFFNLSSRIYILYFPSFLLSPISIYMKLNRFIFSVISYPLFYQLFLSSSFSVDYLLHLSIFILFLFTSTFNSFLLMHLLFFFNHSIIPPDRG